MAVAKKEVKPAFQPKETTGGHTLVQNVITGRYDVALSWKIGSREAGELLFSSINMNDVMFWVGEKGLTFTDQKPPETKQQ